MTTTSTRYSAKFKARVALQPVTISLVQRIETACSWRSVMRRAAYVVGAFALSLLLVKVGQANRQIAGYLPSRQDVARFFPGEVPAGRIPPWMTFAVRYLQLMREPPLSELIAFQVSQSYRVLVETHPTGVPIVAELTVHTDGGGELIMKVGQSGKNPNNLIQNRTASISPSEVDKFLSSLGEADFWSNPTLSPTNTDKVPLGYDNWILEG